MWERRGRGGGRQWSVVTWHRSSPNQEFTVHASMYGKVCLRHGRRLRRASARHKRKIFKISEHTGGATSYAVRHLRNKHNVEVGPDEVAIPSKPALFDIFCYTRFCGATS